MIMQGAVASLLLVAVIDLVGGGQCPSDLFCASDFTVDTTTCLLTSQLCDGNDDCALAGIDEGEPIAGLSTLGFLDCSTIGSPVFDCGDGNTVGVDVMCDGISDCGNFADETHFLCQDTILTFSEPDSLPGTVARLDDTFFGPIDVSEGNGFIFAGEHRQIYIGSNGYFTFGRGVTDFVPFNFFQTDYVVAPFWSDISVNRGGEISFQVYNSFNGSGELDRVNQVIAQSIDGDPSFHGTWMLVAQWTEVAQFAGDPSTNNTFEGILITDGTSTSYAIFIYHCGDINWARNAVVGYRAISSLVDTNPVSFSDSVLMLGCNNTRTFPWENIFYRLPAVNTTQTNSFLTFSDPDSLPGTVARQDDTFFGPIDVSEGNGFIFAGEHHQIYIGSNGYFTFGRGVTDFDPFNFFQTDYVVAPFWSDISVNRGGEIGFQVYNIFNGFVELDRVNQVIAQSIDGDPSFHGTWMLVAQWTEVAQFTGDPSTNNTFEGILITDGISTSYAIFIYRCGDINWAGNAVVGYRAISSFFDINPASFSDGVLFLGCNDTRTFPWENIIYRLPTDNVLTFSDPDSLPGTVARQDDTFFGPIDVSEGNGFIFVGEHRQIYIGSNGYFTFGRGVTDFDPFNFFQTDYVVAPFWSDISVNRGGEISFQVYNSFNGSGELDRVNQVIAQSIDRDPSFHGTWMLVAQWTEVAEFTGDPSTNNTFEGILITDGISTSYAIFIYRCGDINWAGNAVVGYRAISSLFDINPASFSDGVLFLGCNNTRTFPWKNIIYRLPADNVLTFSDPDSLPGRVARLDDTFFGPIDVSEGNGFIFVGEHRQMYIGSNGYFTFGRGVRNFDPFDFFQTDYVVAPFWSDISVNRGGEISFQVYDSFNGSGELDRVNQVITQSIDGDPSFHGTWMLVAQWTEVAQFAGDPSTNNTFEGILITDGISTSYAIFIYRCEDINWAGDAVVGYRAISSLFDINPASFSFRVLFLGCSNTRTFPWENIIYRLPAAVLVLQSVAEDVSEDDGFITVGVVLFGASLAQNISFTITTTDDSATGGGMDYDSVSMMFTMPSGSMSGFTFYISIPINDDNRVEDTEQFTVTLSSMDPDIIILPGTENESISIIDNDFGLFGWRDLMYIFQETDGDVSLFVQLINDVVLDRPLQVQYSCTSGSATETNVDYECNSGNIIFPVGSVQNAVEAATPTLLTENFVEFDENFFGNLESGGASGVMIDSATSQTTVTIEDDTVAVFGWRDLIYSFNESAGTVSLFVELINDVVLTRPLQVHYNCTDGSAIEAAADYGCNPGAIVFTVGSVQSSLQVATTMVQVDNVVEFDENFFGVLESRGASGVMIDNARNQTEVIIQDQSEITLSIELANYIETESVPGGQLEVCVVITAGSLERNVQIMLETDSTVPATATADVDYVSMTTQLTFPAFSLAPQCIFIEISSDTIVEGTEVFFIVLSNPEGDSVIFDPYARATVSIIDDDQSVLALQSVVEDVSEDDGFITVGVVLMGASLAQNISFTITTTDDSATGGGIDYDSVSMMFTMPSGSMSGFTFNISIPINDDNRVEDTEQFTVTLSSMDPDIIILPGTENESISIIDNDFGLFGWRDLMYVFQETDGNVSLFVQLINDVVLDRPLQVQYSCTNGSATGYSEANMDYQCNAGTITFPVGSIQNHNLTATPETLSDNIVETDESFFGNLQSDGVSGVMIDNARSQTEIMIQDQTVVEFTFILPIYSVREDMGNAPVAVMLTGGTLDRSVLLTITPSSNGATAPADFDDTAVVAAFSTGDTSVISPIPIVNDSIAEDGELFDLQLTSSDRAANISNSNSQVLINDDPSDNVVLRLSNPVQDVPEDTGTVSFEVEFVSPQSLGRDVAITFTSADGSAMEMDYTAVPEGTTQVFTAGAVIGDTVSIDVTINDDNLPEFTENFNITVTSTDPTATFVGPSSGQFFILDDDLDSIQFQDNFGVNISEDIGRVVLTVELLVLEPVQQDVMFSIVAGLITAQGNDIGEIGNGTFPAGSTSGALSTVTIEITDDDLVEDMESFTVALQSLDSSVTVLSDGGVVSITIIDNDDLTLKFRQQNYTVNESVGLFSVCMDVVGGETPDNGPTLSAQLVVIEMTATAQDVGNFDQLNSTVFPLPPGTETGFTQCVSVAVVGDTAVELEEETFRLDLITSMGSVTSTYIDIVDDDVVEIAFNPSSYSVNEGDGGVSVIVEIQKGSLERNLIATIAPSPELVIGSEDFDASPVPLTFTPGSAVREAFITILDDTVTEETETLILILESTDSAAIITDSQDVFITIIDDDEINETGLPITIIASAAGSSVFLIALVVIVLVVLVACCLWRRKKANSLSAVPDDSVAGVYVNPGYKNTVSSQA